MLTGQMMDVQLTTNMIMSFAEKVFPQSEVVSVVAGQEGVHRYTYKQAFQRTRQLANALQQAGIQSGNRVATLAWNDYRHFELYYAIPGVAAVCHTINPRLFPEQISYIVNHAEDKLLFTDPMFLPLLEKLSSSLGTVEKIIVLCDEDELTETTLSNVVSYEGFIGSCSTEFQWPDIDENTASSLCYTSGTTGNPKGVLYSHRSLVLHAYGCALPDAMGLSVHDVTMLVVPMFHVNGWSVPYSAVMVGAKLVFPGPKMADEKVLQGLVESERVSFAAGVPTIWLALLAYLKKNGKKLESLKRVVVGGAACPISVMDDFRENYDVDVIHAWGMTETSPMGTVNTTKPSMEFLLKDELRQIRAKQGKPIFGVDIQIIDDSGQELPWDGERTGEVYVRGPWVCSSYYKLDENEAHQKEGWFATGDVANIDDQGYMQITDRSKDVIKSGGEWISSINLENTAVGHPAIREAGVIGRAHPKWTERPLLIIKKEDDVELSGEEILAWLKDKIPKWCLPDDVVFVDELPHTATGKISKKELREQFEDYKFPNLD